MTRSVVLLMALLPASLALAPPAAAAAGCRYRSADASVRVHSLPYRTARTVGVLSPGRPAQGSCGRVWNGDREWTRLDRPYSGYVVSSHVRRA